MRRVSAVSLAVALGLMLLAPCAAVHAALRLPAAIGDHMVVQRGRPIAVWGWTDAGAKVKVTMGNASAVATANASGRFEAALPALEAGGPHTITIAGDTTIEVKDVLVGDVWICSGQSNMAMTVNRSNNAEAEAKAATYPNIRLFTVSRTPATEPQDDCKGEWVLCSPETAPGFSAVGYFFGRDLHTHLKVPMGMINTSWGGTPSEAWTSPGMVAKEPAFAPIAKRFDDQIATYAQRQADWEKVKDARMAAWKEAVAKAKAAGKRAPRRPGPPQNPTLSPHRPSTLYNGMIAPLLPMRICGAIWYQGESNAGRAYQYRTIFPAMIVDWRQHWGQGDFPFFFVQLANFRARAETPGESSWAELREAQSKTLDLPKTGQAVIIDIGEAKDIHPKNKQDVGKRLALAARAIAYGERLVYSGPTYRGMGREDNRLRLSFDHVGDGLVAKGGDLKGFAIAGEDKKWVWATAKIEGKTVVAWSDAVKEPVAVRYGWAENPECTLYNAAGLPASPFRTDDWPGMTVDSK